LYLSDTRFELIQGKRVATLSPVIFAGPVYGHEIFDVLDDFYQSIDWDTLTDSQIFKIAAFILLIAATSHPLIDANDRSSVGLAKFIIDSHTRKNLDLSLLKPLEHHIVPFICSTYAELVPPKENLETLIKKPRARERRVSLSYYDRRGLLKRFLRRMSTQIIRTIDQYRADYTAQNVNIEANVIILADLLQQSSPTKT